MDEVTGPCWVYDRWNPGPEGYVRVWSGGTHGRYHMLHRVTWESRHGAVPDGMELHHMCYNPPCCNPDHLRVVTHAENCQLRKPKTACRKGHDYATYATLTKRGKYRCRPCNAAYERGRTWKK